MTANMRPAPRPDISVAKIALCKHRCDHRTPTSRQLRCRCALPALCRQRSAENVQAIGIPLSKAPPPCCRWTTW